MKPGLPVWRSLLYVPVNVEKYVEKAHTRGADCILLDLEDSVPAAEKENARKLVAQAAARVRRGGADVAVRINRPDAMAPRDLEAAVGPEVNAIAVTKVDDATHLRRLDELVSKLEANRGLAPGHTRFIAMVETPAAFFRMPEIALAVERNVALDIGGEDCARRALCPWATSRASRASATSRPSGAWCSARASSASWARAASTPRR